ncbi:MAG: TIGR03943 family protein [Clostridiales bacterium]|nr:TIGR03943 family protein [Clostridiales bacterium]
MGKCGVKILWLFILMSLTAVLGVALISGNILLYLAPRMVPMVWFGAIVLAGLCVYQGYEIVHCLRSAQTAGKGRPGMLLFFVPVVFILTAVPDTSTPGSLPNQNVRLVSVTAKNAADTVREDTEPDEAAGSDAADCLPCVLEDEHAFFNPSVDLFSDYLFETAEALDGRTVTVYGFVYFDDSFPENTVLVSRLMITCCAADASIVGFHVQTETQDGLELNEWIRVTGTIRIMEIPYYGNDYDLPVLTDGLILRCDAPDIENAYIYP